MAETENNFAQIEACIRELEMKLENVPAHTGENLKAKQKSMCKIKELHFQNGEDKKNQDHMSKLATKL